MLPQQLGLAPFFDALLVHLRPLLAVLLPSWGAASLDSHHAFTIAYNLGEDESLDQHMDDSEVRLTTVCVLAVCAWV